jgi:hypothetical protein
MSSSVSESRASPKKGGGDGGRERGEVVGSAEEEVDSDPSTAPEEATRSYAAQILAARAAYVRAFFASGATGDDPVASKEPEGVNRLRHQM